MRAISTNFRQTYGAPRVARPMGEQPLQGRHRRRWKRTTVVDPEAEVTAEDLIGR
ncbi:MAG TPA: hypothetical protein VFD01_06560 [Candidatus Dormibacteraeota bacterium]|nr:hypothetical protein [Candidatus Dormibacteraeota bacterium]